MISDLIKILLPELEKGDMSKKNVLTIVNNTNNLIQNNLLPNLKDLQNIASAEVKNNHDMNELFKLAEIKTNNYYKYLFDFFKEMDDNINILETTISKYMSEYVSTKHMTCRDSVILKMVYDFNSMATYFSDFLYISLIDKRNTALPNKFIKNVREGMVPFGSLLKNYYGKINKSILQVKDISDDEYKLGSDSLLDIMLDNKNKNILADTKKGFVGNIFYHLSMLWEDYLYKRYEANKETKRLLELKILELKMGADASGVEKNNLNEQIKYYEELVTDLQADMSKYENKYK